MVILDRKKIQQKVERIAIEILEQNYQEKSIILAGVNKNGSIFAEMLEKELKKNSKIDIIITHISISPSKPLKNNINIEIDVKDVVGKVIILIDDVANTGRTMFYACKPLLAILPKKIQTAVLVDRKHKSFPISSDYVGLSLATTLKENIRVSFEKENYGAHLN